MTRKRKTANPPEHSPREAARPYAALVYRGKYLGKQLEVRLKAEPRRVISHLLRHCPVQRIRLTGTPCPATLAELAGSIPTHVSDELADELNWAAGVLCHHAPDLNRFVACRDEFEAAILAGDHPRAEAARERSIREVGHSWWAIEADFLLAQRRGGLEANRTLLQRYQAEAEPWITCLCPFYSLRVEDGLPVAEYDKHLDAVCAPAAAGGRPSELQRYLRFRLNYHRFEGVAALAGCMNIEESHSIVDRYITFVRVAHLAMTAGAPADRRAAEAAVTAVAGLVTDHALLATAGLLQPRLIRNNPRQDILFQVLHDYSEGRYREAWESALTGLAKHPGCFELAELAARAGARAGCGVVSPFPTGAPGHEILAAVTEVLCRGADSARAVMRLGKFAYVLDALPVGAQVHAFVLRHEGGAERAPRGPFELSGAAESTPWLAMSLAEEEALAYLDHLGELYPGNAACGLFRAVRAGIGGAEFTPPAGVPRTRVLKYRGLVLERRGRPGEALAVYRELDAASADNPLLASDATTGKYRCSLELGDTLESAAILARAVALNPRLVTGEMVRQVLARYPARRGADWLGHICWPILHCAANREGHRAFAADHLHDVLDDFLTARGVQKPSDLQPAAAAFDPASLVYLLRNLCVPDVLDSSPWYNSQEEVEAERIRICEWLAELDPPRRADYIDEIAELSRRATMRELTHKAGQSKIYVDTEAIRARLTPAYRARVRRCLMFATLTPDLRRNIETLGLLKKDNFKDLDVKLVDANYVWFVHLLSELKALFLTSNEYGLDSNLSQRIRHGTLLGEIRAHFEEYHLVTQKSAGGEYGANAHWLGRLGVMPAVAGAEADGALRELSARIDGLAHDVRTRWVQIKGPANDGRGMFDYDFSEEELDELYQSLARVSTEDTFIDVLLDALWRKTEASLSRVRDAVRIRLGELLFDALDACQQRLEGLGLAPERLSEFRSAVTACRTQLAHRLAAIAEWFRVDRAQRMPPFRLGELTDALFESVRRYCGPGKPVVTQNVAITRRLQGRVFRPLWDLLFILLDNIAKHAGLSEIPVVVTLTEAGGRIRLSVRNALGPAVDRVALAGRAGRMSGNEEPEEGDLLRREGGTGFTKLHKILRHDLRCEDYHLDLRVDGGEAFVAAVTIPSHGMYDEGAGDRR